MFDFQRLPNGNLSKIIDFCMCSVIIADSKGITVYVNDYFTEISGYTKDEMLGYKPRILRSDEAEEIWETIQQDKEWNGEFLNADKKGEPFWEFARIVPVRDIDDNPFYIIIKQNITRVKELEEKLVRLYDKACCSYSPKSSP